MKRAMQWRNPSTTFHLAVAVAVAIVLAALCIPTAQAQTWTVLHNFTDGGDGGGPEAGVTFDQQGRIYGTGSGAAATAKAWSIVSPARAVVGLFSPIYSFGSQGHDGSNPDSQGAFWTRMACFTEQPTKAAPEAMGTVFSLQPPATACKSAPLPLG